MARTEGAPALSAEARRLIEKTYRTHHAMEDNLAIAARDADVDVELSILEERHTEADLALSDHVAGLEAERDAFRPGSPAHGRARHALAKAVMQDGPLSRGELWESWRYEDDTDASRAPYLAYADRLLRIVVEAAQEKHHVD